MKCKVAAANDVHNAYQYSPEKCSGTLGRKGMSQVSETTQDNNPTDQNGEPMPVVKGINTAKNPRTIVTMAQPIDTPVASLNTSVVLCPLIFLLLYDVPWNEKYLGPRIPTGVQLDCSWFQGRSREAHCSGGRRPVPANATVRAKSRSQFLGFMTVLRALSAYEGGTFLGSTTSITRTFAP